MSEWRQELTSRLDGLDIRPEHEAEIVEELSQHLDDRVADLVADGATPAVARASALADLDAPGELSRRLAAIVERRPLRLPPAGALSHGRWLQARWQDLRYSLRSLRRSPGFTAAVILTLGLTIGPTTALLSIGNWLLWRPTPGVVEPDRLALVSFARQTERSSIVASVSHPNLDDLRRTSRTLAAISGVRENNVNLAAGSQPAREARGGFVTADFFATLGVRLTAGRVFTPEEDRWPHGAHVVVISHSLAVGSFGGPAQALHQRLLLNAQPMTVVGVLQPEFIGTDPLSRLTFWAPAAAYGYVHHSAAPASTPRAAGVFNSVIVRRRADVSFAAAQAELDGLLSSLVNDYPEENKALTNARATVTPRLGLPPTQRTRYAQLVGLLAAIGGVLLLLGSANAANLMAVRVVQGQRERAVRLALGASRGRLILLQGSESVLLACGGAAVGVALAVGLKQFIATLLIPVISTWSDFAVPLDTRVLAATLAVSVVSGLIAGLVPALVGARTRSAALLGHPGDRAATGARRLRGGLAGLQLALSLALVTGALLLVATLQNLSALDLGFDPTGVTVHRLDASRHGYPPERRLLYYQEVFQRLRGTPAWTGPALSASAFGSNREIQLSNPASADGRPTRARANAVSDAYFDVLGIRVTKGRGFTEDEVFAPPVASPSVVVVSDALARHVLGSTNPVGRRLVVPATSRLPARELTIIGVSDDARWDITGDPPLELYFPLTSPVVGLTVVNVLVKSAQPLRAVTTRVEAAAMTVDPTLPVQFSVPFGRELDYQIREQTTFAWVLSMLGWLGLALAAVGLAGILAQSVAERTREFGIRIAVGSGRARIFGLVLRQAAWIGGIGTVAGLGLAYWGSRLIEAQLYGVTRTSPSAYAGAAVALLVVVFVAGLWPACTATRIEPAQALRSE